MEVRKNERHDFIILTLQNSLQAGTAKWLQCNNAYVCERFFERCFLALILAESFHLIKVQILMDP